jgi:hypothetical protein
MGQNRQEEAIAFQSRYSLTVNNDGESPISVENLYATEVIVNVFDGGPKTKVDLSIGGAAPVAMMPGRVDPLANELFARNEATKKPWVKAEICSHMDGAASGRTWPWHAYP